MLDTGIAASGDLAGRVVASADLSGEWSFTDSYGHGTFMAGLIAGSGQAGGPAGVAPGADLVDLKVAGADGATTLGQVLAALQLADAARDRFNLRVLNISLGAPADDPATAPLTEAVERLWADGITVVAASGNEGGGTEAPGLDPYVRHRRRGRRRRRGAGLEQPRDRLRRPGQAGPGGPGRRPGRPARPRLDHRPGQPVGPGGRPLLPRVGHLDVDRGGGRGRGPGGRRATRSWGPDRIKAALTGSADPVGQPGSGAGALDLGAALGTGTVPPANADLFPLRTVGRAGTPRDPEPLDGLDWRAGGADGLRWAPAGRPARARRPGPTTPTPGRPIPG